MRHVVALLVLFGVGCSSEDGVAPAGRTGDRGESETPSERLAILQQIGEVSLYQRVGTDYEQRVPVGNHNADCEQVTPQNFEEYWPEFELFAEACLEPDFELINNALDPQANQLAVRAFTPRRSGEVVLDEIKPDVDFTVKLHHFYDGSDLEDDMNDAFWEFITVAWQRVGDYWVLEFIPKTDRLALTDVLHDPTAYLDVCVPAVHVCAGSSSMVLGVNPSIEGAWEVTQGPTVYAAEAVRQFDRIIEWDFTASGKVARGTLEFGELKVEFEPAGGPEGVQGSGSFRVAEITDANEMRAFYQHSTPGAGQETGDLIFRRVQR
ncbi:MAG: hypothetical protein Q7S89_00805 [bacterium]|nr:hypothetical protein [bacterium]